jgi:hypothetical protein
MVHRFSVSVWERREQRHASLHLVRLHPVRVQFHVHNVVHAVPYLPRRDSHSVAHPTPVRLKTEMPPEESAPTAFNIPLLSSVMYTGQLYTP